MDRYFIVFNKDLVGRECRVFVDSFEEALFVIKEGKKSGYKMAALTRIDNCFTASEFLKFLDSNNANGDLLYGKGN